MIPMMEASHHSFSDDGDVPNSRLPLIVYSGAIAAAGDAASAFEALFHRNGWGGGWRNGIFPFHHYHSTAHEVLGIARGEADVRFGGEGGTTLHVRAGDAVLIPAGVGHKRISATPDLLVVGAYPAGQWADLMREGAEDKAGIRARIAAVKLPEADPVAGKDGPMRGLWKPG
ncbi:MAG TPA: cupin domain-containing protein [Bauldia sp.]|nr:cupin domain-containing protein [Bauldia sp.]